MFGPRPQLARAFAQTARKLGEIPEDRPREDTAPRVSLARKLAASRGGPARLAHWLFIRGGMATLVTSGLLLLGLLGLCLARR